jgi:hypothetical protein
MKRILSVCIRPMAVAGIFLTVLILHAQVANNTALVGAVVDPSGAPVSGAKVTAVNEATQVTYPGVTKWRQHNHGPIQYRAGLWRFKLGYSQPFCSHRDLRVAQHPRCQCYREAKPLEGGRRIPLLRFNRASHLT